MNGRPEGYGEYIPETHPSLSIAPMPIDNGATVYDFKFDSSKMEWMTWADTLSPESKIIPPGSLFGDIIVPTKDSARSVDLLSSCTVLGGGFSISLNRWG